jgi:hypothetical protein
MATKPFMVETGLMPGHDNVDIGHTDSQFGSVHLSGDIDANGALTLGGDINATGTIVSSNIQGSVGTGGDSGVTQAASIAFSIALG